jgi:hypothetical protein
MKRFLLASLLALFCLPAFAQFTQVSGTVTDPYGVPYSNGTISAVLVISGTPTLNGQPYTPPTQPNGLNLAGAFGMQLADNTQLSPGGSQWNFTVCSGGGTVQPAIGYGPICFTSGPMTISGTSQNLSSTLNALAPALTVMPTGAYAGLTNGITVSGNNHVYHGTSLCAALASAATAEQSGILHAEGFQNSTSVPAFVCPAADLTSLSTALASFYGEIHLGCPLNWWLPLMSQGAATSTTPRLGSLAYGAGIRWFGCGTTGAPATNATTIRACPASGGPTGCTAAQTHEFAISSATLSYADSRTYLKLAVTGADLIGREPVRIQNYNNVAGFSFSTTVCQLTQVVSGRLDPGCPANPTATQINVPVLSGIVTATITNNGSGGISGTLTTTWSGGSCATEPTTQETLTSGSISAVTIIHRGRGCTSTPTATVTGSGGGSGTLGSTIMTGCASSCGTLHAELPLFDIANATNANFSDVLQGLTISCSGLPDCVPVRCDACQEQSQFKDLQLTGIQERGMDMHSFQAQNATHLEGIRITPGPSPTNDVGTEAIYIGDAGPHGILDFTGDFSAAATAIADCIRIDADAGFSYWQGGHCELALYGVFCGSGNPCRGLRTSDWAGAPQSVTLSNGPYQQEYQSGVKISSEYFTNASPVAAVTTSDYSANNIIRNGSVNNSYTVNDDNPLGAAGNGFAILDTVTEMYAVDQGGNGCETVYTSSQFGTWTSCAPWYIAMSVPAKATIGGLASYCPAMGLNVGGHAIASNCNAACSAGGTCTAGGSNVCEMYCQTTGAWIETGR